MADFAHERRLGGQVAGVDEAGRGPLAGPVVAAAVMFADVRRAPRGLRDQVDDSKKLTRDQRDAAFARLIAMAHEGELVFGVAASSVGEIDRLNILGATFQAMRRAVARLSAQPDHILVDGNLLPPGLSTPATPLIGGDGLSLSIAAASILAKVIRDRAMTRLAARYPAFGWEKNAGYGTSTHTQALAQIGPCKHHRLSFAPCAQFVLSL